jgi:hypothetical protein
VVAETGDVQVAAILAEFVFNRTFDRRSISLLHHFTSAGPGAPAKSCQAVWCG